MLKVIAQCMCLRVDIALRLFHILAEADGRPVSVKEMAQSSGAEMLLIGLFPFPFALLPLRRQLQSPFLVAPSIRKPKLISRPVR